MDTILQPSGVLPIGDISAQLGEMMPSVGATDQAWPPPPTPR